jgi:hypothetical protein
MMTVIKMMHADAGHGWLAVKTKELVELGIADKISSYSFYKGKTTYLEEDCDAGLYINAQTAAGVQVITKSGKNWETCPVRFFKRVEQVVVPQTSIDEAFAGQKFEDVDQETLDKEFA